MFDHISIGVRDIAKAKDFYDAALKPLGLSSLSADETSLGYCKEGVGLWIYPPNTRSPMTQSPGFILLCRPQPAERLRVSRCRTRPRRTRQRQAGSAPRLRATILRGLRHRPRRLPARSLLRREIGRWQRSDPKSRPTRRRMKVVAVRDIGALHTRLVPGFVADTRLEPARAIMTFVNGVILREPIVTIDDEARRLVWTAEGGRARHYNAALEVASLHRRGDIVVWTADFLPDELHLAISRARLKPEWRRCSDGARPPRGQGGTSRLLP